MLFSNSLAPARRGFASDTHFRRKPKYAAPTILISNAAIPAALWVGMGGIAKARVSRLAVAKISPFSEDNVVAYAPSGNTGSNKV